MLNKSQEGKNKDLISDLKEVLDSSDLLIITKVLKKLKDGVDHSQVFEDLFSIFFKDSKTPNNYEQVDQRRECIKKLI